MKFSSATIGIAAGIHTVEVRVSGWNSIQQELPYLRSFPRRIGNEWAIELNLHKASSDEDGKYKTLFGKGAEAQAVLIRAEKEMGWSNDWRLHRIDYAFNLEAPYAATTKFIRLFVLMMGHTFNLKNRYYSIDPLTLEEKSFSVRTKNKKAPSQYQFEHYDRSQIEQEDYDQEFINRLEVRLIGNAIADKKDAFASVKKHLDDIGKAINPQTLAAVEDELAHALVQRWEAGKELACLATIQRVIRTTKPMVYTRWQMVKALEIAGVGNPMEAVKELTRKRCGLSPLYTIEDIRGFYQQLEKAFVDDADMTA